MGRRRVFGIQPVSSLDEAQRERLIATYGRRYRSGEVIFRQGDPSLEVYVLQDGRVRLTKQMRRVERNLALLKPGDVFGETGLLGSAPRPCSALTLSECTALCFDMETFETLVRTQPELALRLMRQLVRRLRDAEDQVEHMLLTDGQSRLVNVLLKLAADQVGAETGVRLDVSPLDLSARAGVDVDTVKRGIHELRDGDYVRVADEQLEIPDVRALQELFDVLGMREELRRG